mgnify:CR=1 FL=1
MKKQKQKKNKNKNKKKQQHNLENFLNYRSLLIIFIIYKTIKLTANAPFCGFQYKLYPMIGARIAFNEIFIFKCFFLVFLWLF